MFLLRLSIYKLTFKSSEHIKEKGDVPYRGFGSDHMKPKRITVNLKFLRW